MLRSFFFQQAVGLLILVFMFAGLLAAGYSLLPYVAYAR
jgi:hypothetical protein